MLDACRGKLIRQHGMTVGRIERDNDTWRVCDATGAPIAQAPHLVLANGTQGNRFAQTAQLPLSQIRGQVTHIDASILPDILLAICGDGYITPGRQGICSLGATYDNDDDTSLRADSQRENLARLPALLPGLSLNLDGLPLQGRTGFRSVAPDRLPLIGQLPDHIALAASRAERLRDVPRHAGLHALLGLASRGLTWAPLAAELLAAQMSNEPLPLERDLLATLDPARFALLRHRAAQNRH
jgi:tRNA 5-methylaminomethyl-2-thiouridine biosynthesis bifunctional protein